jgi:tRNA pseudouridine38-40 synthase
VKHEGTEYPQRVWSSDRRTLLLELSYLGRYFHGVELQGERRTVASELQQQVASVFGVRLNGLVFASRTDAGVSALQNFATGWCRDVPAQLDLDALCALGPSALVIRRALWVPRALQARNCARSKHYRYRIATREALDADAWRVVPPLDVERMQSAARLLVGHHDFAGFRAASCQARTTLRTLYRVQIHEQGDSILVDVEGDGFLKRMVRVLVGTLATVGAGFFEPKHVLRVLATGDRSLAGITAPAEGLTLQRVSLHWPTQRHAGMPLVALR